MGRTKKGGMLRGRTTLDGQADSEKNVRGRKDSLLTRKGGVKSKKNHRSRGCQRMTTVSGSHTQLRTVDQRKKGRLSAFN